MAFFVSYNAFISVGGVDLSDHCTRAAVNFGQETRDATAHGDSQRKFRAGLGTPSAEATFWNDHDSGSVEATLRGGISITSTGLAIAIRQNNAARGTTNPEYSFEGIIDGDLMVLDDEVGELPSIGARFLPYSTVSVITSAS